MENAAHAEPLDHEVYHTPLVVQPEFEYRNTPKSYRYSPIAVGKLPDKIKVWRVQNTQRGNVVARGCGFEDSPDAEVLAVGFNDGKECGDVGIGRHGNVLQWGYGDPPSRMTEAGRRLFVNCIGYIHRFDGRAPLVHCLCDNRLWCVSWDPVSIGTTHQRRVFRGEIPQDIYEKYRRSALDMNASYLKNLELIYWDNGDRPSEEYRALGIKTARQLDRRGYRVDTELQALGISSNRRVETLGKLIELLDSPQHAEVARRVLARYTCQSFDSPAQWRQWFETNRERIFFSDIGGYKFFVVPEGYLPGPDKPTVTSPVPSP